MSELLTQNDGRAVVASYALFPHILFLTLKFVWQLLAFPTLLLALPEDWTGVMWHGSFISAAATFFTMYFLAQIFTSITLAATHFARYQLYHWGRLCEDTDEKYPNCPKIRDENKHWLYTALSVCIYAGWFLVLLSQAPPFITELTLASGSLWSVAVYLLAWFGLHAGIDASYSTLLRKHLGMDAASYSLKDGQPLPMDHPVVIACEQRLKKIAAIPGVSKLNWALRGLRPEIDDRKLGSLKEFEGLEAQTGLKVKIARSSYQMNAISVRAISHARATVCKALLSKELDLYPSGLFSKIHFKQVVLCSEILAGSESLPGYADVQAETLYLAAADDDGEFWFKRTLHHEIFHLIDFHDDLEGLNDRSWERLNRDLKGDTSCDTTSESSTVADEAPGIGFLNAYSRTAVHEDKAEFFSLMVTAYNQVVQSANQDEIIAKKFERMKRILQKVDARFDNEFWEERAKTSASAIMLDCRPGQAICMK